MGDRENAAAALAHMPRWVAVHENTLAKLDVALAMPMAEGWAFDDLLTELDRARSERDRALGVEPDAAPADRTTRGGSLTAERDRSGR